MKLQSVLAETDLILIGLGEAFQESFSELEIGKELKNTIFEEFARMQYLDNQRKGKIDHAYDILAELLKNRSLQNLALNIIILSSRLLLKLLLE